MPARGITLTREIESLVPIEGRGDGFRIRITASLAEMMPNEVFLFRENVLDPVTGLTGDEFCAVASPEDIVNVPIGTPNVGDSPPFFRKAVIDVIVGSRKIAEDLWDAVKERVCALVDALDRKDRLAVVDVFRCGDPVTEPPTSISSSVSESLSVSGSISS